MNNDLSDEAFWQWAEVPESKRVLYAFLLEAWQECRRRAEAQAELIQQNIYNQIDERERQAFEAGMNRLCEDLTEEWVEKEWRAYKEKR